MTPGRILLVVAGLLIALGAAFLVSRSLSGFGAASTGASTDAGTAPEVEGPDESEPRWEDYARGDASEMPIPRPLADTDMAAISPFGPSFSRAKLETLGLRLEGLVPAVGAASNDAMAMISGQLVRIGDSIDDFRVTDISKFGVSLVGSTGIRVDLGLGMSTAPEVSQAREAALAASNPGARAPARFLSTISRAARESGQAGTRRGRAIRGSPGLMEEKLPFYLPLESERSPSARGPAVRRKRMEELPYYRPLKRSEGSPADRFTPIEQPPWERPEIDPPSGGP